MEQVAYYNDKPHTVHIGGKAIGPGQTREVDERDLPSKQSAETPAAAVNDPLLYLLDLSVNEFNKRIPDLLSEELVRLKAAEEAGKPRKGVIGAIEAELLERAGTEAE